ncbi:MAG: hypothetical protein AUJ47_10460 [Candidatus Marinimicrobia bacterium CG1_02_48_14]|nr:MAG: hypothetical protein AUJ47_10460 [Candidatus Marinimicrobia bacterium CG1_02_48_14]
MTIRQVLLLTSFVLFLANGCSKQASAPIPSIVLSPGSDREVVYTDKGDAFFMTRSGGFQDSPWHGLRAAKRPYFKDFILFADGKLLDRQTALVTVRPDFLVREYPDYGISVTWSILDTSRALAVQIESKRARKFQIIPILEGGTKPGDFQQLGRTQTTWDYLINGYRNLPASFPFLRLSFSSPFTYKLDSLPPNPDLTGGFQVGLLTFPSCKKLSAHVQVRKTPFGNANLSAEIVSAGIQKRTQRIQKRLNQTPFKSNSPQLDSAVIWAHASMDALIMQQMGGGIYAGLPWFDEFWGRDEFITFPGAVLVSGEFELAKRILKAFGKFQDHDPASRTYGRVPNRAQPTDIIYNTTDGTPWFVREVWDYYRYSGDGEFLEEIYPTIKRAAIGAIRNWVDEKGLLTHDDADTWMDARGPDGPWSPRGNRAVDIQQLWLTQLEVTRKIALIRNDVLFYNKIDSLLKWARSGYEQHFRDPKTQRLFDHLNTDGSPDLQIRPNALLVPPILQDQSYDWLTFLATARELVTANGILSLAQSDQNFHPYHQAPGLYVKDAAYHNGIIWMWNAGPWMSAALDFGQWKMAGTIFSNLTQQVLHRGAIGTLAEVSDAWPQSDGQVRLSGTVTQAWSLGEYLRVLYQDILGFRPLAGGGQQPDELTLQPRLLSHLKQVAFTGYAFGDSIVVDYEDSEEAFIINLRRSHSDAVVLTVDFVQGDLGYVIHGHWASRQIRIRFEKQMRQWTVPEKFTNQAIKTSPFQYASVQVPLCVVQPNLAVQSLSGPGHRLLKQSEVKKNAPAQDAQLIFNQVDSAGDDHGDNGQFTYPTNQQFQPGIADITSLQIWEHSENLTFRLTFSNLVDPGWHPEYGYQLTYVAIGLDSGPGGAVQIGKNGGTTFPHNFTANRTVYVSGGIQIHDEAGKILAEYMPLDEWGAIGDVSLKQVQFSLPRELFPTRLESVKWLAAVGLQDDHGGAGLGDFRVVEVLPSEWSGGGNSIPTIGNVYDWLAE